MACPYRLLRILSAEEKTGLPDAQMIGIAGVECGEHCFLDESLIGSSKYKSVVAVRILGCCCVKLAW